MTDREYLQKALHTFNGGNWYGWKTHDDNGNYIGVLIELYWKQTS